MAQEKGKSLSVLQSCGIEGNVEFVEEFAYS